MNFQKNTNGSVDGYCLIKTAEKKVNVKGAAYLDMVLCDSTGEITAKLWDYREDANGVYQTGDLVKIRGTINQFNGMDQLRIDRIRHVMDGDDVDESQFVPTAEYSGESMLGKIYEIIAGVKDEELKNLTYAIIKDSEKEMLFWPAAFKLHHAMRGGLLYHTLSIAKMAENICEIYPSVNKDLLMCGVVLHDICKIDEFDVSSSGLVSGYSVSGELLGHLVMGAMKVSKKADELNISKEKSVLLEHMLISHHGQPEFGAAVRPMFLEAEILCELDTLDATIFEISNAVSQVNQGEFTPRQWALDNRKLYRYSENEIKPRAILE